MSEILTTELGLNESSIYVDFAPKFLQSSKFVMVINDNINNKIIAFNGITSRHCYDMICHSEKLKSFIRCVLSEHIVQKSFSHDTEENHILYKFSVLMSYEER